MQNIHFDQLLEEIGPCGRYQILVIILTGLAFLSVGGHNVGSVFLAGLPTFHCKGLDENVNVTISYNVNGSDTSAALITDACSDYTDGNNATQCSRWIYERDVYKSTIATQWDLVCSQEWKLALFQSLYMLGFLIGALLFGNMSDVIGRKLTYYIAVMLMTFCAIISTFMPNYWLYALVRVVNGATSGGVATVGFVITMEVLGMNYRTKVGIFYQGWFAAGYMILAVVAYFIRDYTYIQLYLGLSALIFIPYWWLLRESPRWLMAEGRHEAALAEIKQIVRMNKRDTPEVLAKETKALVHNNVSHKAEDKHYTLVALFRTPNMRRKTINAAFNWFVISMIYYGLSMGVGNLAGGPYLNLFLSGLIEFPAYIIAVLTLDRIGRRIPLVSCHAISGVCCITMACIPPEYGVTIVVFSLLGKMAVAMSFSVIYVYSAELVPTVIRTLGVGFGSGWARVGSLLSPFIALLATYWKPLPSIIFGSLSLSAAVLALFLPETLNQPLPETMEDGEAFGRNCHRQIFRIRQSSPTVKRSTESTEQYSL